MQCSRLFCSHRCYTPREAGWGSSTLERNSIILYGIICVIFVQVTLKNLCLPESILCEMCHSIRQHLRDRFLWWKFSDCCILSRLYSKLLWILSVEKVDCQRVEFFFKSDKFRYEFWKFSYLLSDFYLSFGILGGNAFPMHVHIFVIRRCSS